MSHFKRWDPGVADYLQQTVAQGSKRDVPPLAVLDYDNTCVRNDIGEAFHVFLIEEQRCDFSQVVPLVPEEDGGVVIAELWRELESVAPAERALHPRFAPFRDELLACYVRRLERLGKADTYRWHIRLLAGLTESEVMSAAADCVARVTQQPLEKEEIVARDTRFQLNHGIRPNAAVVDLVETLHKQGWDVWIVSASNQWIIQAASHLVNVDAARAVGGRLKVGDDGRLLSTVDEPYTVGAGKVGAIDAFIGRRPQLAMGDSYTDQEMLESAERAIIIDRGDDEFRAHAKKNSWAVQPAWWL